MSETIKNPLLTLDQGIDFPKVTAEHIEPALNQLMKEADAEFTAIAEESALRSYQNTMQRLEAATEALELAITVVGHLESVRTTDEFRAAYNKMQPEVSAFFAGIALNEGLYRAVNEFATTEEAKTLSATKQRFLEKTLRDFKRHGAELDAAGKKRLQEISRELSEITAHFGQRVLDDTAKWEMYFDDAGALKGLPESALAAAKASAKSKDKEGYRITLQAPSLIPVLTYAEDSSLRENVYRAYNQRGVGGEKGNEDRIPTILKLRKEKAQLLGHDDFPNFILEERMAKNGQTAQDFVKDLAEKSQTAFAAEKEDLLNYRRTLEGEQAPELNPWDLAYYAEKQRQALYAFDEEALRPYFSADKATKGVFEVARRLYGVEIEPASELPVWNEKVDAYRIFDAEQTLGYFYVDLYPREDKRGGAWMNGLVSGTFVEGKLSQPHIGLIAANVTPAVGDTPALLTQRELTTLFHEFGHLLHHLLSQVEVRSLAGTNVAWDFVELPSQIFENWCWEREALDLFATHYQTDEKIPEELFSAMTRARTFREGTAMMRQLGFASVDLALHRSYQPDSDEEILSYCRGIMQGFAPAKYDEDYGFIAAFTHLFSSATGYASAYYSYKWAEVLDADAFTRFAKEGIFSSTTGKDFREQILSRGDAEDPMELYKAFMGREPSLDPLLERSGLSGASA